MGKRNLVDRSITDTKVRLVPIKTIISYQITEEELNKIEKGFDGGVSLNIAIGLAAAVVSLFATYFATTFPEGSMAGPVILTLAITLSAFFLVFILFYLKTRKESNAVFEAIRSRKDNLSLEDNDAHISQEQQ